MNRKRTLAALATTLIAVAVAGASGATFSAASANPSNTFTSGDLTQSNSKSGASILTGSNMKPGDVSTGEVTITNTGSLAGDFKLSETNVSNTFGPDSLHLNIVDVTGGGSQTVYNGDLGEVASNGIALGSYAGGEAHTYRFTVTLDAGATAGDQGKSASADYHWTATQS
jgi:hypothetical protein